MRHQNIRHLLHFRNGREWERSPNLRCFYVIRCGNKYIKLELNESLYGSCKRWVHRLYLVFASPFHSNYICAHFLCHSNQSYFPMYSMLLCCFCRCCNRSIHSTRIDRKGISTWNIQMKNRFHCIQDYCSFPFWQGSTNLFHITDSHSIQNSPFETNLKHAHTHTKSTFSLGHSWHRIVLWLKEEKKKQNGEKISNRTRQNNKNQKRNENGVNK